MSARIAPIAKHASALPRNALDVVLVSRREDNEYLEEFRLITFNADSPNQKLSECPRLELEYRQPRYGSLDGSKKTDRPGNGIAGEASSTLTPSSPIRVPSRAPRQETLLPTSADSERGRALSSGRKAPAALQKQSNVRVLLLIYMIYAV